MSRQFVFGISLLTMSFLAISPATAQFDWQGNGNNQQDFNDASLWTPNTGGPGSANGGSAADTVTVTNQRNTNAPEAVWITAPVGTVSSLTIGGNGSTGTGTNTEARVQVRNPASIDIGTLTLGTGGGGGNPGQFLVNSGGSSATVGTIVSDSSSDLNRIVIGNNVNGGFTLAGDIDAVGTRSIDLFIQANDDVPANANRVVLSTGSQTLSVDTFRVGTGFNNANPVTSSFTLDNNNIVEANEIQIAEAGGNSNGGNMVRPVVTGTFTVTNASATAVGPNGENGNVSIGRAQAVKPEGSESTGTANVGAGGTLGATGVISLGTATTNGGAPAGTQMDSVGVLNVNDPTALVTAGRVDSVSNAVAGGINVGTARTGEGTINLSAGEIQSKGRVYLGGDSTNGPDVGTMGTVNISGTGLFTVGVDPNGGGNGLDGTIVDVNGATRNTSVNVNNSNFEVGRDGTGVLNLSDSGQLILARGNLVLGQSSPNMGPGLDVNDELGQPLAVALGNTARGTITATDNSVIQVGLTQGANPDGTGETLHDLNYNNGGGDITLTGNAALNVERNISFGPNDPGQAVNTLTVSDTASVDVGFSMIGGNGNSLALVRTVPEPSTLALLGLAIFGLVGYCRKRS